MTIPHYTDGRIAELADYRRLVDCLTVAFRDEVIAPVRLSATGVGRLELLAMPAISTTYAGAKILTIQPDNAARALPTVRGLYALFDAVTGAPLATMDAGELTARRTAAVSALAARQLSREEASTLLLIGSGHLVPYLSEAHAAVRPIRRVLIWARDEGRAWVCAEKVRERVPMCSVDVVSDRLSALAEADIVSSATGSDQPLVRGDLLRPGTHIDAVGGYRPDMREVDDTTVVRSMIYVDTHDSALAEAGDLISPIERGVINRDAVLGDLRDLVTGVRRRDRDAITLFKSVGSAISDLAAAECVWRSDHE